MTTKHLKKAAELRERQIKQLASFTESILKPALRAILAPHIKNRRVWFRDVMGSTTVDIDDRRGGNYVINSCDAWYSPAGPSAYGYSAISADIPWIKEICELIAEYNELAEYAFALEFEL